MRISAGICEYADPTGTNAHATRRVRVRKHETPMADRSAINHGGLRYRLAGSTRRQTAAIWLTFLAARAYACMCARVRVCTRGNC